MVKGEGQGENAKFKQSDNWLDLNGYLSDSDWRQFCMRWYWYGLQQQVTWFHVIWLDVILIYVSFTRDGTNTKLTTANDWTWFWLTLVSHEMVMTKLTTAGDLILISVSFIQDGTDKTYNSKWLDLILICVRFIQNGTDKTFSSKPFGTTWFLLVLVSHILILTKLTTASDLIWRHSN